MQEETQKDFKMKSFIEKEAELKELEHSQPTHNVKIEKGLIWERKISVCSEGWY